MIIAFDNSFYRGLKKISDKDINNKIKSLILDFEVIDNIYAIPNLKKMAGFKTFYRIRVGDYRIGVELRGDVAWFIIIAHRKDIYKKFP